MWCDSGVTLSFGMSLTASVEDSAPSLSRGPFHDCTCTAGFIAALFAHSAAAAVFV